ncbi:fructose-bisphosphatase class I [Candidatus Peregrinibacteria bacterium CG_4_9_14_0_2_um_filter_53_11]|nr:MAG: fructose-bisphosphatase class I [Candidatus Peregrinibacteria bacterium CG_4_9_14_0_2_um_filter_53_11]
MVSLPDYLSKQGVDHQLSELIVHHLVPAIVRVRSALDDGDVGYTDSSNSSGDIQRQLDVESDEIFVEAFRASRLVRSMATEEREELVTTETPEAPFSLAFDPLDGSSLVDVNFAVGSIFGFYRNVDSLIGVTGRQQVASCIVVYGPRTTMLLTVGRGVVEFRLTADGEMIQTGEKLTIEPEARYFAPGNLRAASERAGYRKIVNDSIMAKRTLRYSGGMVPDVNHIFLKGSGVFLYPGYSELPQGKLRLLFECAPIAFLIEQAGGVALSEEEAVLDIEVTTLHQRSPIICGSSATVTEFLTALRSDS